MIRFMQRFSFFDARLRFTTERRELTAAREFEVGEDARDELRHRASLLRDERSSSPTT
jgi:hypothetical protein